MINESKCLSCKNYIETDEIYPICKAFPEGIPRDIWGGRIDHKEPYENDNGIRFEQKEN